MKDRKRLVGQKPTECPACNGWGYTPATCTEYQLDKIDGRDSMRTTKLGSGCPRCLGTGQLT